MQRGIVLRDNDHGSRIRSKKSMIGGRVMKFVMFAILVLAIFGAMVVFVKLLFAAIVLLLAVLCMLMILSALIRWPQV